jgi:hypothetical protein
MNVSLSLRFWPPFIENLYSKASHDMRRPKKGHIFCRDSLHCVVRYSSPYVHIITCISDSQQGFELEIRFIYHFNTRLMITFTYSAIVNLHTLQITRAHVMPFPVCSVFTSSCLVTASNSCYSSSSGVNSFLNGRSLPSELSIHFVSILTPGHGPPQKTPFQ